MNWMDEKLVNSALTLLHSDKLIAAIISSIVSYFISKNVIKLNNDKEKIKNLCLRIEAVEELEEEYWDKPGKLKHLEREIVSKLQIINEDISELNSKRLGKNDIEQKLINFRQNLTGGLFESEIKAAEPGRIQHIRSSANSLRNAIKLC